MTLFYYVLENVESYLCVWQFYKKSILQDEIKHLKCMHDTYVKNVNNFVLWTRTYVESYL